MPGSGLAPHTNYTEKSDFLPYIPYLTHFENFKMKMHNNEFPAFRLAYEMIVNQDDYNIDYNTLIFSVKNKDIFYYAHVGGLDEIKYFIQHNPICLNQKDKLGRTILYIAARNGYYSLCK